MTDKNDCGVMMTIMPQVRVRPFSGAQRSDNMSCDIPEEEEEDKGDRRENRSESRTRGEGMEGTRPCFQRTPSVSKSMQTGHVITGSGKVNLVEITLG